MTKLKIKGFLLAAALAVAGTSQSAELIRLSLNEGSGTNVTDSTSGLVGTFGARQDPAVDYSLLMDASPSGQAGDRCVTNSGGGFLVAKDTTKILDLSTGPITIETWIYINGLTPAKASEGLVSYGTSYKMGMKGGYQVFTLFGLADITNSVAGQVPVDSWVHLAAAWEPGVGVHFFINGSENFVPNTFPMLRAPIHNYLSIGSEGFGNNSISALDRVRIHHALLTASDLDSDALNPKAPLASTLVNYGFNESSFPCTSSLTPPLPTILSSDVIPMVTQPTWSSDSPTHLPGDFSLAFSSETPVKDAVTIPYNSTPISLGANNTNYTLQCWIKLPNEPLEERRVILRTDGDAPRIALSINQNRALHTTIFGNTDFVSSILLPNDNRWHHFAVVMEDFARMRFYLDGILRQTINRTATGATTAGTVNYLLLGKESDTRYFNGLLDRVIINNNALTNSTLDYPAIPGLPTFPTLASHPVNVTNVPGTTVSFTATPTGATSVQWYFRSNLADQVGMALPGQTANTLILPSITPAQFGYYYLVASNAVGTAESYAARLNDITGRVIGFEAPAYKSGPIEDQDNWFNDQNSGTARVLTASEIEAEMIATGRTPGQTVHSGNQALYHSGNGLAPTSIRVFTGLETKTNVTVSWWARPLAAGTVGTALGNVFITLENGAGTRAAAVRFGPNFSIDWGSTNSGTWVASGQLADPNTWAKYTLKLNYGTRFYDLYVNDVKLNPDPIPFYVKTSDSLRQIRVFHGASQAGLILDDLDVPGPVKITSVTRDNGSVIVNWQGGTPPYQLQRRNSLTSGTWENVGSTTSNTSASDPLGAGPMYYRVGSD